MKGLPSNKDISKDNRKAKPPNNPPPIGRRAGGSSGGGDREGPMYTRLKRNLARKEERRVQDERGAERMVQSWDLPCPPKLYRERKQVFAIAVSPTPPPRPRAARSRPISSVFLAAAFALVACWRRM